MCYNSIMNSKENRTAYVIFRVTEHEKELLKQDANTKDMDVSELVREKLGFEN